MSSQALECRSNECVYIETIKGRPDVCFEKVVSEIAVLERVVVGLSSRRDKYAWHIYRMDCVDNRV